MMMSTWKRIGRCARIEFVITYLAIHTSTQGQGDMRKLLIAIVLVSGITLLTPTLAAASKKSDQKLAETAILRPDEVPDGFAEAAGSSLLEADAVFSVACEGAFAAVSDASLAAPHASSGFQLDQSLGYGLIESRVTVLPKTAAAKTALNAYQDDQAVRACVGETFEKVLTLPDVTTEVSVLLFTPEVSDKDSTKLIKGGDEFVGLVVSVERFQEGGESQFFNATVVFGRVGRATFQLTFMGSESVPRAEVQAMAQAAVTRLKPAR